MFTYLEIHGGKPAVWITAAHWDYDELRSPQEARIVFIKASTIQRDL